MLFNQCTFKSTHNSYVGGLVGSIARQLSSGVRCLELDIHPEGEFPLGHLAPGDSVALGGENPPTLALSAWLHAITDWCTAAKHHAPVTVFLDLKQCIGVDQHLPWNEERFERLNSLLLSTCSHLVMRRDLKDWPDVRDLRSRMLIVISGDFYTRRLAAGALADSCFVEQQPGEPETAAMLASGASTSASWLAREMGTGKATRLWNFTLRDAFVGLPTFPATDTPFEDWYTQSLTNAQT